VKGVKVSNTVRSSARSIVKGYFCTYGHVWRGERGTERTNRSSVLWGLTHSHDVKRKITSRECVLACYAITLRYTTTAKKMRCFRALLCYCTVIAHSSFLSLFFKGKETKKVSYVVVSHIGGERALSCRSSSSSSSNSSCSALLPKQTSQSSDAIHPVSVGPRSSQPKDYSWSHRGRKPRRYCH
jgi:hypothetical protein